MKKIILASSSPRRKELLNNLGMVFDIIPSNIEEKIDDDLSSEEVAKKLSYDKALSVSKIVNYDALVIGADTIVIKNGILGKPRDAKEAFSMLKMLQDTWHEVITGITVIDINGGGSITDFETTRVKMLPLIDEKIWEYINTGEPMDKAGSYGISGKGALFVERIEGCFYNVVGLPLVKLSKIIDQFV